MGIAGREAATTKVFLNGRFLAQRVTGVQRYAREILKSLDRLLGAEGAESGLRLSVLVPPEASPDIPLSSIPVLPIGRFRGQLWEQIELPLHARGSLLVGLCNSGPILQPRQVVVFHDAAVFDMPSAYSRAYRTWARFLLRRVGRRAVRLLTVSSFSRQGLADHLAIDPARIRVVPPGADHMTSIPLDPGILDRLGLKDRGYFLAVGSQSPAKNFEGLLAALKGLGEDAPPLVVVGGKDPRIFSPDRVRSSDRFILAGYLEDRGLRTLYGKAIALVCPSFYEGFGIPPLEAMACGCPVIVSRAASLPEVCGDAALYCDPNRPESIAAALRRLLDDASLREDLRRRGPERAGIFCWDASARAVLEEVRAAASRRHRGRAAGQEKPLPSRHGK